MKNTTRTIERVDLSAPAERRFAAAAAAAGGYEVTPDTEELHRLTERTRAVLEALEAAILPPVIQDRPRA